MSAQSNANPDFYRSVIVDESDPGRKRTVIYSTLDQLYIGNADGTQVYVEQVLADDQNLTIYALDLTLVGAIVIPGGDIRIYCKRLTIHEGIQDPKTGEVSAGATLDVSPKPLQIPYIKPFTPELITDASPDPRDGADGDTIAETLQKGMGGYGAPATPKSGSESSDQFGTKGPNAGSITLICDSVQLNGRLLLRAQGGDGYPGCSGQKGGPNSDKERGRGGRGGNAGRGGSGGDGGNITIRCREVNDAALFDTEHFGPGAPGMNGEHGEGGLPRGERGGPAANAEQGIDGVLDQRTDYTRAEMGRDFDETFLLKVMQKTKRLYLYHQPTNFSGKIVLPADSIWAQIGELAHWLEDVLRPFPKYDANAPLSDSRKHTLVAAACGLTTNFKSKLTYFGTSADFVTSIPIKTLLANLQASLETRLRLEQQFVAMREKYDTQEIAQQALTDTREALQATAEHQLLTYRSLFDELEQLQPQIEHTSTAFDTAKDELLDALKQVPQKVKDCFSCDMEKVMQAGESFAFTGGEGASAVMMGGLQLFSLWENAKNKIALDGGGSMPKATVIDEVVSLGQNIVQDATGAVFDRDPSTGELTMKPGKRLLLASMDKFDAEINRLKGALGPDYAASISAQIRQFKDTLNEKGETILLASVYAMQMVEQYDNHLDTKAKLKELEHVREPLSPFSAGQVSHFARLYQQEIEKSIEAIAALQAKLAYMTLDYKNPIDLVTGLDALWKTGVEPSEKTIVEIMGRVNDISESFTKFNSIQGSGLNPIPATADTRSDLYIHIKPGLLLDRLKETGTISFVAVPDLPPITPPQSAGLEAWPQVPVINSHHYHEIRISHARARVYGAITLNAANIYISITTGRRSTLIGPDKVRHTFLHDAPRVASVTHAVNPSLSGTDNKDMGSGHDGKLDGTALDMIGLYTTWTIEIPKPQGTEGDNSGLDLSGVTDLTIHFDGACRDHAPNGK